MPKRLKGGQMKLFDFSMQKEGKGTPAPSSGWPRAGVMALTFFWRLVAANFLFVVFSLPLLTLPAALTALNRVCVIIYRDGNIFLWHEFRKEFRRSFARSLVPGIWFALLLFGGYFFMSLGSANSGLGIAAIAFWSLGILMAMTALAAGEYFFVMISVLEIRDIDACKNALIFCFAKPGTSLAILVIIVVLSVAAAMLMPLSFFLIPFIWVVLAQYPICYIVYDLIEKMILVPHEQQQAETHTDESDF